MRGWFGFVGLLIVIAALALVARDQLPGMRPVAVGPVSPASAASASFEQRSGASGAVPLAVDPLNPILRSQSGQVEDATAAEGGSR